MKHSAPAEVTSKAAAELRRAGNRANAPLISSDAGRAKVRVVPANEALMIERPVRDMPRTSNPRATRR